MGKRVTIEKLVTRVPGLDDLLGGGVPEFSFNLIAGPTGSGKTTLAHQLMFSMADPNRRALFFTTLGEPPLKMLRYQQQFDFFDFDKLDNSIRFVNLAADIAGDNFDRVSARISDEVQEFAPRLAFIDSFDAFVPSAHAGDQAFADLRNFIQQLAIQLSCCQATTFVIGAYPQADAGSAQLCAAADGILLLSHGASMTRTMQVVKMRGAAHQPGAHPFRIDGDGLHVAA